MKELFVQTKFHTEFIDITNHIGQSLPENHSGIVVAYVPHTTCGLLINEGADPAVMIDLKKKLEMLVPWNESYFKHMEGNSAAHIKAVLTGNSVTLIVEQGKLMLGTWESVFLAEFDGPRRRKLWLQFL